MKSFSHRTGSFRSLVLRDAMLKFGSDAYAAWWVAHEIAAERAEVLQDGRIQVQVTEDPQVFVDATLIPESRLEAILQDLSDRSARERGGGGGEGGGEQGGEAEFGFWKRCGKWVIKLPNLLALRDQYTYRKQLWAKKRSDLCTGDIREAHLTNTMEGREGGVGGEKGKTPLSSNTAYALTQDFAFCSAPHRRTMERNLKDLLRRGVSPLEIRHAAARGREAKAGFFEIVRELEKGNPRKGQNGSGSVHTRRGRYALPEGYLEERRRKRIEERERGDRAASGDGNEPT